MGFRLKVKNGMDGSIRTGWWSVGPMSVGASGTAISGSKVGFYEWNVLWTSCESDCLFLPSLQIGTTSTSTYMYLFSP